MTRPHHNFVVQDSAGRREVAREDFPLAIGGASADIRLNGSGGGEPPSEEAPIEEPLAYLGLSEGDVFVQPASDTAQVACNGTRLTASHWLEDGDVLRFAAARLAVEMEGAEARFIVRQAEAGGAAPVTLTAPPREDRAVAGGAKIRPIAFQPSRELSGPRARRAVRWGSVLVALFIAALAGAAAFVFTSRSILVEVEPLPDQMTIEGGIAFEIGGRHLLRPGNYVLAARKEGFRTLEAPFEVTRETNQTFRYELERLPGLLDVRLGVEGARILSDGEELGVTPLDGPLEIAPGEHEIRIRAERYREHVAQLTIEGAGLTQVLEVELEALWAAVAFSSEPGGATVRVDGATLGRTPLAAEVLEGRRSFELFLAGYKPHRGRIAVKAGEDLAVPRVTLVPSDGNVVLLSEPDGAAVTVDGVYRGEAPIDLRLEPGRPHDVKVSKAGYASETRQVEVEPDEARELRVVLTAEQGEVRVAIWPADAELFVDGRAVDKGRGVLQLSAVEHVVEVRKTGFAPFRTKVTPMPGIPQSIEVSLESVEEKQAEATPQTIKTSEGHELRRVEPGRFLMGASRREPGRRANEALREVELTQAFYLGTMEVSNEQYRRFKAEHLSGQVGGRTLDIENHPVVNITWDEAATYCNWLSAKEGLPPAYILQDGRMVLAEARTTGYRLPTEAEWAWAARFTDGKTAVKFPWGPSLPVPPASGNYADSTAKEILPGVLSDYNDQHPVTSPVTGFKASPLGFFNLGGNVAEWIHDLYAIRPAGSNKVARDPVGPEDGDFHVIRGSSWMHSTVTELRLTYRDYGDKARPDVGFRIARYVE